MAGPDAVYLETELELQGVGFSTVADFTVTEGQTIPSLSRGPPTTLPKTAHHGTYVISDRALVEEMVPTLHLPGIWRNHVVRSLITLKALTLCPTGGIVAAPTTSLQVLGGVRGGITATAGFGTDLHVVALMSAGYHSEAKAWREWLLRAVAGNLRTCRSCMASGENGDSPELELNWLPGIYEQSAPVRIGNAASQQFQLDVYGEMMDTLHQARGVGARANEDAWRVNMPSWNFLRPPGIAPTKAFGKCAARVGGSPIPR